MKKKKVKDLKSEADKLWSQIIRFRGICERCDKTNYLQAAHIYSKRAHPELRFELSNGLCLCNACHIYWAHREPMDFANWVERQFPERYNYLQKIKNVHREIDYVALLEHLKGILNGS